MDDSGLKIANVPRRIARVFINIIAFPSWRKRAFQVMVQVSIKTDASESSQ